MKVYQLKVSGLDYYLEPVFKTKEAAMQYKESKYIHRELDICECTLDISSDYVYRIKYLDDEGYMLGNSIFSSLESARENGEDNIIVKENILSGITDKCELVEV